jgi:hypothetical protein
MPENPAVQAAWSRSIKLQGCTCTSATTYAEMQHICNSSGAIKHNTAERQKHKARYTRRIATK